MVEISRLGPIGDGEVSGSSPGMEFQNPFVLDFVFIACGNRETFFLATHLFLLFSSSLRRRKIGRAHV